MCFNIFSTLTAITYHSAWVEKMYITFTFFFSEQEFSYDTYTKIDSYDVIERSWYMAIWMRHTNLQFILKVVKMNTVEILHRCWSSSAHICSIFDNYLFTSKKGQTIFKKCRKCDLDFKFVPNIKKKNKLGFVIGNQKYWVLCSIHHFKQIN